jgi:hypothetical protein
MSPMQYSEILSLMLVQASYYKGSEIEARLLAEQTLRLASERPSLLVDGPIDQALFSLMHCLARGHFR